MPKGTSRNMAETRKPLFPQQESQKIQFFDFFRKLYDFRFCATCVLFQSFGVRKLAKVQQRLNSQSSRFSKDSLQTSVGKLLTIHRKKSKMSKYLSISDIFFELSFQIGNFWRNKTFERLQTTKLGPKHVFQKLPCFVSGRFLGYYFV